jgi:D-alanine-D-alanine ligase
MDKPAAKRVVAAHGLACAQQVIFEVGSGAFPSAEGVVAELGHHLVIKPADQGSSIGLHLVEGKVALQALWPKLTAGNWLIESRLYGRELSVGLLGGKPMGVVEVLPEGGVYDYKRKYAPGSTRYQAPALLEASMTQRILKASALAYQTLGCRDVARIDLILDESNSEVYFLEMNTMPGLTPTSLLPKSAACSGLGYIDVVERMVAPALARWHARYRSAHG